MRTYVDSWVIRVPFFGFSFDVNDLGFIGGIGFVIILVCFRLCLSREIDNLRLSFEQFQLCRQADCNFTLGDVVTLFPQGLPPSTERFR